MSTESLINLAYIAAAILFVFGIKMLGSADTARRGNMISSIGMLIAVVITLLDQQILTYQWIFIGLVIGGAIGAIAARVVKMTGMPELVALFNGFGGLASLLVGWGEYNKIKTLGWEVYIANGINPYFITSVIFLAVLIGAVTFTGSLFAWGKLSPVRSAGVPLFSRGRW